MVERWTHFIKGEAIVSAALKGAVEPDDREADVGRQRALERLYYFALDLGLARVPACKGVRQIREHFKEIKACGPVRQRGCAEQRTSRRHVRP